MRPLMALPLGVLALALAGCGSFVRRAPAPSPHRTPAAPRPQSLPLLRADWYTEGIHHLTMRS